MKIPLSVLFDSINFMLAHEKVKKSIDQRNRHSKLSVKNMSSDVVEVPEPGPIIEIHHYINFESIDGIPIPNEDLVIILLYNWSNKDFEYVIHGPPEMF